MESLRMLDADDRLRSFRTRFRLPADIVYMDANSLGALPSSTLPRLSKAIESQWGRDLIRSWDEND